MSQPWQKEKRERKREREFEQQLKWKKSGQDGHWVRNVFCECTFQTYQYLSIVRNQERIIYSLFQKYYVSTGNVKNIIQVNIYLQSKPPTSE